MHLPTLLLSATVLCLFSATAAQKKPDVNRASATIPASGKQTYMQYCASCHGVDARGTGPASSSLKTPPPDLTTLAKRHSGKFPEQYVTDVLRFGIRIVAHGSSDMPTWGPIFGALENYNDAEVQKRIKSLCDYLASLQEKES